MNDQQIADLIVAEYYGKKTAGTVSGILDVIQGLRNKGLGILDIIKYGPTIVALLNQLIPLVTDIADRVQKVIEVIMDAFQSGPTPPVVNPLG